MGDPKPLEYSQMTVANTLRCGEITALRNKLLPKDLTFVEALLSGERPGRAVITAGYEVKTPQSISNKAARLLKKDIIRSYLAARYAELQEKTDISLGEVKGNARLIIERCMGQIPVIDRKTGEPTGEWTFDANGANKANDTLMRLAGLDKTDTGARTQIQFNVTMDRGQVVALPAVASASGEAVALPEAKELLEE